jgi:hypothetical protein
LKIIFDANEKFTRLWIMKILLGGLLVLSLGMNIFLWSRLSRQSKQLELSQVIAAEVDQLRQQNQELQSKRTSTPDSAEANLRELARLRNEVGQLRKQTGEVASLRAQAAEAAQLRARLAVAAQNSARSESAVGEAAKLTPEQMQQMKDEALAVQCVSNLKQIGLSARMWANDHQDVFPPDFISMTNELGSPKVLFCPADPSAIRVTEWSQLNPSTISYRFLNPGGNEIDPTKLLTTCPIHGHVGLSDGSVQRKQ